MLINVIMVIIIIIVSWYHLKITQKIPEQPTGIARYEGSTENSHTGHCTQTAESADV